MQPLFDIYVACCTPDGGVVHFVLSDDGSLVEIDRVSLPSPLYMVRQENCLHVLLCDPFKTGESGYTTISLRADGTLGEQGKTFATGGGEACFLSLFDERVYVANYETGSVARLSPDGTTLVRSHTEMAKALSRDAHPHCIAPSPDGRFLLCADLGLDTVIAYDRDLNPLFSAKTPAEHGPRHLAYSPDGRYVYSVNEIGNSVTVFSYENGKLTPLKTLETLPENHPESYAAALRLYDGRLYISHRGDDSVTVFGVDGDRLVFEERIPSGGRWPRDFDRFGDFLLCTNEKSDSVTVLHQDHGTWTPCAACSLPRPLCVVGNAKV